MNSMMGLKALRRTIELTLQKLNMVESQLSELSREELLEIMANENLDLSWIASQESVDALRKEVGDLQTDVNRIGEHLVEGWKPPYTSPDLAMFSYDTDDKRAAVRLRGFSSMYDHLTDDDIIVVPKTMIINDIEHTVELVGEFTNIHMKAFIADGVNVNTWPTFKGTYISDTGTNVRNDNLETVTLTNIGSYNGESMSPYASSTFAYCPKLKTVNTNFSVSVTPENCAMMFNGDSSITSLDLTAFDFSVCTNGVRMFDGCTNLTEILVTKGKWIPSTASVQNMFRDCGVDHVTYVG